MGVLRAIFAELVGTFVLTLAGAGAVCLDAATGGRLGPVGAALTYASGAVVAYHSFPGAPSRFNPAMTLADLLLKRLSPLRGVFSLSAQLLGAACAGLFLRAVLTGGHPALLGEPTYLGACLPTGIGYRAATLVEAVATFFLALALIAGVERRARRLSPLYAGMAVLFGVLGAGPLTGAALNPARAFGPAIAAGRWAMHYVYWVGPLAGAVAAALAAPYLVLEENRP